MKLGVLVAALLGLLTACHPADVNVRSVQERLEGGEIIEYTEPGAMRENCRRDKPPWDTIRINSKIREQVVLGKMISILSPGRLACYRVGSEVRIEDSGDKNLAAGRAIVTRIAVVKLEHLRAKHMKGQAWANAANVERTKKLFAETLKPADGVVTITDLKYIKQSAVDELRIIEKDEKGTPLPGEMEQTEKDGDRLPGKCSADWKVLVVDPEFQNDLLSGQLGSWYQLGALNCFTQGQDVALKTSLDEKTPAIATVKIFKIKRLAKAQIQREHFIASKDFDFAKLKAKIESSKGKDEFITIMDIAKGDMDGGRECNSSLTINKADQTAGGLLTVEIVGSACARQGDLIELNLIQEDGQHRSIPARVVARYFSKEKYTTTLLLEPVGGQP